LIDLKPFSFRITFVRVGIYFGLVLAKEHKRESLAIKLLNLPYSGIMLFKNQRKAVIEEQGRLAWLKEIGYQRK
jgi:ATP adenylyltransferase/5',5'''-P-1,P-4-tetraphosphate phosphorylase II